MNRKEIIFPLRMSSKLKERIEKAAEKRDTTITGYIRQATTDKLLMDEANEKK